MAPVNRLVAERAMFVLALSKERRWPAFGGGGRMPPGPGGALRLGISAPGPGAGGAGGKEFMPIPTPIGTGGLRGGA